MSIGVSPSPVKSKKPLTSAAYRQRSLRKVSSRGSTSSSFDETLLPYLNEISDVALLTLEEEIALAQQIERGRSEQLKPVVNQNPQLIESGQRARHRLIEANLRLVVSIARRYCGYGLAMEDLVSEGNLGLIRTIETFDYTRGYKFSTYATWWIRQAIRRGIAEKARLIRLPVYIGEQVHTLTQTRHSLFERLKREPSEQEIAAEMGCTLELVRDLAGINYEMISLEKPLSEEQTGTLADILEDRDTSGLEAIIDQQILCEQLESLLAKLEPRSQLIMRMRFGLLENSRTYSRTETGNELKISRERVRQIEYAALQKLRWLIAKAGEDISDLLHAVGNAGG